MISYCITVYNEIEEIERLLSILYYGINPSEDEIVVIQTYKDVSEQDTQLFNDISSIIKRFTKEYHTFHFNNNFSDLKNYMTSKANMSYIFNLDADEYIDPNTINIINHILKTHDIDLYYLPRVNTVSDYTEEDIKRYKWTINESNWINWPDYQPRIYRNNGFIKWVGSVHEYLQGFNTKAFLDANIECAILHPKSIEKQRKQNTLYETIQNKS